jgi:methylmalonyl-CoA/ethylmalonyl-CoA epimerase
VEDLGKAIEELADHGYEVVDTSDRRPGWKETFVRPSSGFGALLQLAETTLRWDVAHPGITLEAVLEGEVVWGEDDRPHLRAELDG